MDRGLHRNEIAYLLDHLNYLYSGAKLGDFLKSGSEKSSGDTSTKEAVIIPISTDPIQQNKLSRIGKIPVLFPCSSEKDWYKVEGKSVHFHHDILKSAFYLLSGYQEYESKDLDIYGRFPWKSSIQYQLGITHLPVVNYYFEVILDAFEKFCQLNGLEFERKLRKAPVLFLSHDVDRIKKYTLRNLAISVLQLLGLKADSKGFRKQFTLVLHYARGIFLFRKNPYWNFQEMIALEQDLQISSTWFFLEKTKKDNSKYRFHQERIRTLIRDLSSAGHEIGIHGTIESSSDQQAMEGGIKRLNAVCDKPVSGIRQHYLKYQQWITPRLQAAASMDYDATLGFAEQPGFRNSYAMPFRLFDFEEGKAMDIWQLPLNVMDSSLLDYMDVPVDSFQKTIRPILEELIRFKGIFSLLWHNCRLDEEANPGVKLVYRELLEELKKSGFESQTGRDLILSLKSGGASGNNS
jgi:peptidoglycan/xylan/chitin deacetylase (PgdA/CDA1 family)